MGDLRAERLAKNEALFRVANERMAAWEDQHQAKPWERSSGPETDETYFCECADTSCESKVRLTREDYEAVRANSRHFVLTAGHEIPDVESVIRTGDDWVVVEKDPDVSETVRALDPRNTG